MTFKYPIVFIHGFSNNPGMWQTTIDKMPEYECYTIHLNDIGLEMKHQSIHISTLNYAEAIQQHLFTLGIQHFHLVGHSMGGYISAAYASLYPECILSLSLVHSILGSEIEDLLPLKRKTIQLIEKGTMERNAFLKAMINNLFSKDFIQVNRPLAQHYFQIAQNINGELLIDQYKAIIERPPLGLLSKQLPFPIHWVIGKNDKVVPAQYSFDEVTHAPKSYISYLKGSSHMGMDEELDSFCKALLNYFRMIEHYYLPH